MTTFQKSQNTTSRLDNTMPGAHPKASVLIVEGGDEKYFVEALMTYIDQTNAVDILRRSGAEAAISSFRSELKVSNREAVGLIVDADDAPAARWSDIATILNERYSNIPAAPDMNGTVLERKNEPNAGVWIMPDNQSLGEFEHFLIKALRPNDPHWPLAQRYVNNAATVKRLFEEPKTTKAELRAWLAVRREPGLLGEAVRSGDLNLASDCVDALRAWLGRLYPKFDT